MKSKYLTVQMLMFGAGYRILGALIIVAFIWAGFYWATSSPGGV